MARQCAARRLVLVALGRGHSFASLAAVQAELSPLVAPFLVAGPWAGQCCSVIVLATILCHPCSNDVFMHKSLDGGAR